MFSLAALRYRSILCDDGGPIESIEEGIVEIIGKEYFQANAKLIPGLGFRRVSKMYSDADGSGVHSSRMVARHIAISEALERWAYQATVNSTGRSEFGFDVDWTSNGMAAFPGLFKHQARRNAKFEAIERYFLLNWWEGNLDGEQRPTRWTGIRAIHFEFEREICAVILFHETSFGRFAYGHAASESFEGACNNAVIELIRQERVIINWIKAGSDLPPEDSFERRAWFFSTSKGFELFKKRLSRPQVMRFSAPRRLCDKEIVGPWSDYATVWRCLFQPPSHHFMESQDDYFFW